MERFKITPRSFWIDGEEKPLLCGEIHYFRMPKAYWGKALDRLVECGCQAVAYYVPWFVHEPQEGRFDFTGELHPDNDLQYWMKLTQEKGLLGFVRPGPYIYAETTDLGIPRWFGENYPNAHIMAYSQGKYVPKGLEHNGAHNHPDFIKAVGNWYREVCRQIRPYQAPQGNIVLFQLCNEIPNDDIDDRNPENLGIGDSKGLFPSFLSKRYGSVENLNRQYQSDFTRLETIEPHMLEEKNKEQYNEDHLSFYYEYYYPHYFKTLAGIAREIGVSVPFVHNAYNPRAVSLHYHNKKENPWLNIGVDCYYSMTGRIGLKDVTYFCEFGAEYIKAFLGNVPWVIEQECGYWNDFPTVYGPELYIFNIWTLAAGYKGLNMYLFAGGINRPGMGFFGTDHNWQAPVNEKGEKQRSYEDIKRSMADILKHSPDFMQENRYDLALGIKNAPGLIWRNVSKVSSDAYFALRSTGFMPKLLDFEACDADELHRNKALWVVSDQTMSQAVQEKLLAYAKGGGKLVIQGCIPYKDEFGKPATHLADALGVRTKPFEDDVCHQKKLLFNGAEYFIGRKVQEFDIPEKAEALLDEKGCNAGALIGFGQGAVLLLPFRMDMQFNSMSEFIRGILGKMEVRPTIEGQKLLRVIPKANGRSIILNLHPVPVKEKLVIDGLEQEVELEPHTFVIA